MINPTQKVYLSFAILSTLASCGKDIKTKALTIDPNPTPNTAPIVSVGSNKSITLPTNSISLVAAATDSNPLTYSWNKISGAGTVTFSAPNALTTTVTFSAAGTYTLRFTASDGSLSSTDDVIVTVNPTPITGPTKLSLSGPPSVVAGSCSTAFVVVAKDASDVERNVTQNSPLSISGLGTAVVYSNNTCTTVLSAPTIAPGASRLTFYIKDSAYDRDALPLTLNLSAQTSGLSVSNSLNFVQNHGVATKLVFTRQPSSSAVEEEVLPIQPIVKIQDASSNTASSFTDAITLTAMSDASCNTAAPGVFFGGSKVASDGIANFNLVRYMQPGTINLKATATGLNSACSGAINLSSLGPETFTLTVKIMGNGNGNVQAYRSNSGNNISCDMTDGVQSGSCEVQAPPGTVFKLYPYKASPSFFMGFTGTTCSYDPSIPNSADLNTCGFTITQNLEVDVYFQESEFALGSQGIATVSNIAVTNITRNSATITWTTAKLADSKVRYGLTNTFGIHSSLESEYKTSHSITLENLNPNTLYNYRALSRDITGLINQSGTLTFTTAP